jgi:TonB family protein
MFRDALILLPVMTALSAPMAAAQQRPTPKEYVDHVGGTIVPAGKFEVEGRPAACGSRPTVLDYHLDDITAAYPQFPIVNPARFAKLSPTLKLWTFGVACGFALFGPDPTGADCYAVRRGKKEGWLSDQAVDEICTFLLPTTAGRYKQVPGPERCERLRRCYRQISSTDAASAEVPAGGMRPSNITHSSENDEFGRSVVRALRGTMPQSSRVGRLKIRLLLDEQGRLSDLRLVESSGDSEMEQNVLKAAKGTSFPNPPAGSSVPDRTFLVTYVYR